MCFVHNLVLIKWIIVCYYINRIKSHQKVLTRETSRAALVREMCSQSNLRHFWFMNLGSEKRAKPGEGSTRLRLRRVEISTLCSSAQADWVKPEIETPRLRWIRENKETRETQTESIPWLSLFRKLKSASDSSSIDESESVKLKPLLVENVNSSRDPRPETRKQFESVNWLWEENGNVYIFNQLGSF